MKRWLSPDDIAPAYRLSSASTGSGESALVRVIRRCLPLLITSYPSPRVVPQLRLLSAEQSAGSGQCIAAGGALTVAVGNSSKEGCHVTHNTGVLHELSAGVQRHGVSVDRFRLGGTHAITAFRRYPKRVSSESDDLTTRRLRPDDACAASRFPAGSCKPITPCAVCPARDGGISTTRGRLAAADDRFSTHDDGSTSQTATDA